MTATLPPLDRCKAALEVALNSALDARDNGDAAGVYAETILAYITASLGAVHTAEANSEVTA